MKTKFRILLVTAALTVSLILNGSPAHAQDAQVCQPGIGTAIAGPHTLQYQTIISLLFPAFGQLQAEFIAMVDQTTYAQLLSTANSLAGSIATGRVVITLPDGTVVLDTARDDNTANPTSNSYQHFLDKTINENHNSRLAILAAQQFACGIGLESKFSTSTGQNESYVAIRAGAHLDSFGTIRMSTRQ